MNQSGVGMINSPATVQPNNKLGQNVNAHQYRYDGAQMHGALKQDDNSLSRYVSVVVSASERNQQTLTHKSNQPHHGQSMPPAPQIN